VTHTLGLAITISGGLAATGPMTIGLLVLGTGMLIMGVLAVATVRRRRLRFVAA